MRRAVAACVIVLAAVAVLHADVVTGEVKKVDAEKGILILTVKDKNQQPKDEEFKIPVTTKIQIQVGRDTQDAKDGLKDNWFRSASMASGSGHYKVELTREKQGDKQVPTKILLHTPTK